MPNGTSLLEADYLRGPILGRGASGVAFIVRPKQDPQRQLVAKEMCIVKTDEKRRREALAESQLLRELSHINIVVCYDIIQDVDILYIVMEYANGGDLSRWIHHHRDEDRRLSEQTVMSVFVQICAALHYIHSKKILHRDLKPANIFLCGEGDDLSLCTVKLGDFGIAKMVDCTLGQANSTVGTPSYLPPELCKNNPYGMKADIWSLGVVLYELTCLKVPFHAGNLPAMAIMICTSEAKPIPEEYSVGMVDLVKLLLQKDPANRPHIVAVLALPYVQAYAAAYGDTAGAAARLAASPAAGVAAPAATAPALALAPGGQAMPDASPNLRHSHVPSLQEAMPDVQPTLRHSRGTSLPTRSGPRIERGADGDVQRLPSCGPGGRSIGGRPDAFPLVEDPSGHWCWQRARDAVSAAASERRHDGKGRSGPTPRTLNPVVHVTRSEPRDRGSGGGNQGRCTDRGDRPERLEHLEVPRREPAFGDWPERNGGGGRVASPAAGEGEAAQDFRVEHRGSKRPERGERGGGRQDRSAYAAGRGGASGRGPSRQSHFLEVGHHRNLPGLPQPMTGSALVAGTAGDGGDSEQGDVVPLRADAGTSCVTPRRSCGGSWPSPVSGDLHLESALPTPEHNVFARTDEDLAAGFGLVHAAHHQTLGATGLLLSEALSPRRVPLPAEHCTEPAPPFADPHASSVIAGLVSSTVESQPRVRHRKQRRMPCGRPPLFGGPEAPDGQELHSPSRIPSQRVCSSSSSTAGVCQEPLLHSTAPLPSSASALGSLAARSVSPSRTAPLAEAYRSDAFRDRGRGDAVPAALRAERGPGGGPPELPVPGVLRASGSAPALPPLPKILAPKQPFQRSRSSVGLQDTRDIGKLSDPREYAKGYTGEAFQPGQHGDARHMFRSGTLPSTLAASEASSAGQGTLPPPLAPPVAQAEAGGLSGRPGPRERVEDAPGAARLAPKLSTALTAQGDTRHHWHAAAVVHEGWGDAEVRFPAAGAGRGAESARMSVV